MSYDIHHEVGIDASLDVVFKALSDTTLLSKWWTVTKGSAAQGGELEFWFNAHVKKFKVIEAKKDEKVRWKALDGDGVSWGAGEVQFHLFTKREKTFLHFVHSGWSDTSGAFAHCTTKWGVFMLSLKDLIEKSEGRPFPKDIQVN